MSQKTVTAVTRRDHIVAEILVRSASGLLLPSPRRGSPAIKVRRGGKEVGRWYVGDRIGPKDLPSRDAFEAQVAKGRIVPADMPEEVSDGE